MCTHIPGPSDQGLVSFRNVLKQDIGGTQFFPQTELQPASCNNARVAPSIDFDVVKIAFKFRLPLTVAVNLTVCHRIDFGFELRPCARLVVSTLL